MSRNLELAGCWALRQVLPALLLGGLLPWAAFARFRKHTLHTLSRARMAALAALLAVVLSRPLKTTIRLLRGEGHMAPVPRGRMLMFGHLLTLRKAWPVIWDYVVQQHAEIGRTLRFVVGPEFAPAKVFVFSTEPACVEHILKSKFEKYGKGPDVEHVFHDFLGEGIFAVDGERWRVQRKTAATIFSRRNFSMNMLGVFQAHARRLVSLLAARVKRSPGSEVEIQELFFSMTLDAFCEIGFGFPWKSIEEDGNGVDVADDKFRRFGEHFDRCQAMIVTRFAYRPFWMLERVLCRCGVLPAAHDEAQLAESVAYINQELEAVVDNCLQRRLVEKKGDTCRSDLLSLFAETTQDRTYLRDIVMSFILAGRDTTACTLTWLFWELSRSPEKMQTVRDEVLLEAGRCPGSLGFDALARLKYCTACVRETVRLHPPVPVDPKVALADDVLPDGTLVSKGDYVFYEPYAMARDSANWGFNAAEWLPERWLDMQNEPSTFVNCAFQAGPRICLGRDMALLEAKAVLAEFVLSDVEWEPRPDFVPSYRYPSLVLPMSDPGLPLSFRFAASGVRHHT
mmetsp:Transcript_54343/g.151355  ORF Transcript_54343/g.151355 Transcript_54343/m.151355 type:complete len:568 (-) Transcript_54343:28-1731(-)